jgi:ketosteroid isomerase-like protein
VPEAALPSPAAKDMQREEQMEAAVRTQSARPQSEHDILQQLNHDYIRSVEMSDVRRFAEILADDFLCSKPDGSLIDKQEFLRQTARPAGLSNLEALDVKIRITGDFAIIHARTQFTLPGGTTGSGRYTDIWARRNGSWLAVAAHVTRC